MENFKKSKEPSWRLKKKGWNVACEDGFIILYDSVVRAVWVKKGSRPTILTTGSHSRICIFGAMDRDRKQFSG